MEVKTIYDANTQKKVSRFIIKSTILNPINIIYPIVLALGILIIILSKVVSGMDFALKSGLLLVIVALGMPLFLLLIIFLSQNAAAKSNKQINSPIDTYFRFDTDSFFSQSIKNGDIIGSSTTRYTDIFKAVETKTDFFIYINRVSVLVVPKCDVATGQVQQISDILKNSLGKKFKIKTKM